MYIVDIVLHIREEALEAICRLTADPQTWLADKTAFVLERHLGKSSLAFTKFVGCSLNLSLELDAIPPNLVIMSLEEMSELVVRALKDFPAPAQFAHVGVIFIAQKK